MSFNDLGGDLESQQSDFSNDALASPEFTKLTKSISQNISIITSNVATIHRYIGLLRTPRDTERMRTSLMETLAKTKSISKDMVPDIRKLSRWNPDEIGPSKKFEQHKLAGDFQKAVIDFQNAQKLALEKQKDFVKEVRQAIDGDGNEHELSPDGRGQHFWGARQIHDEQRMRFLDNSEVAFNEELIEEREHEIQEIEQGIVALNEIFRDLATIVTEQGSLIGHIGACQVCLLTYR